MWSSERNELELSMLRDSIQGECAALLMRNEVGSIPTPSAIPILVFTLLGMPIASWANNPFETIPLFSHKAEQKEALMKAQIAASKQIGLSKTYEEYFNNAKSKGNSLMERYSPIDKSVVYFVAGTAYSVGVKNSLTLKRSNATLQVSKDAINVGLRFPF